jgi:hypothetical protein
MRPELLDRLAPIRGFGDKSNVGFPTEQGCYALPDEHMIVNGKHPDLR